MVRRAVDEGCAARAAVLQATRPHQRRPELCRSSDGRYDAVRLADPLRAAVDAHQRPANQLRPAPVAASPPSSTTFRSGIGRRRALLNSARRRTCCATCRDATTGGVRRARGGIVPRRGEDARARVRIARRRSTCLGSNAAFLRGEEQHGTAVDGVDAVARVGRGAFRATRQTWAPGAAA